jgi:uncharacterized phage protein gp47/JayE
MAYTPPTIAAIKAQIITDIEGAIGQSVPILPKAFVRVLAAALAGALSLLYRFGAWIYRQIFPQTADGDALILIGGQYGLTITAAVNAILTATATGVDETIIPAGTIWYIGDLAYSQISAAEIASGTATITIECLTAGDAGNLDIGDILSLSSPIAGVDGTAVIASIVTSGEDQEATDDFRTRVMERIQRQPQGGSIADYVSWTREVAGIVKAFAFRTAPGEVTVYPLQAITGSDRVPIPAKITEVQTYVSDPIRRPLCADVLAAAMDELSVDITITGLLPNETDIKTIIEDAIEEYLYAAYPKQYPDEVDPTDVVSIAAIWSIIDTAGANAISVTMTIGSTPYTSYPLGDDEIAVLGVLTWA